MPEIVNLEKKIYVFGVCIACGVHLESIHVVGTFMFPCQHQYHLLFSSAMLHIREFCAKLGCNMVILKLANYWISGL